MLYHTADNLGYSVIFFVDAILEYNTQNRTAFYSCLWSCLNTAMLEHSAGGVNRNRIKLYVSNSTFFKIYAEIRSMLHLHATAMLHHSTGWFDDHSTFRLRTFHFRYFPQHYFVKRYARA